MTDDSKRPPPSEAELVAFIKEAYAFLISDPEGMRPEEADWVHRVSQVFPFEEFEE